MQNSTKGYGRIVKMDSTDEELEYSFRLSNTSDDPAYSNTNGAHQSNEEITSTLSVEIQASSSPPSSDPSLATSPLTKSPWSTHVEEVPHQDDYAYTGLMGSLVREEGHIYSLAAIGDLLYTGSDSKNIRVWKNQKEFSGFKSNSGLVKAIIIAGEKIFTGHQDGKIRLWKVSTKNSTIHKRVGSLPRFRAVFKSSMNPSSYRRSRNVIWLKHFDAISCLSLNEDKTLLYSSSWDRTIKVWRVSNSKCLESINAHEDAVNAVVAGFDGLVFTGSADGTVKVWRREVQGKGTKHFFSQTLLKQECAVTALAVDALSSFLYCGSSDGLVNFWEHANLLSHGGVLRGHKLAVLCLAASANLIFSGSADTNICVWRRDDGVHSCLSLLSGHTGPVKCLAVEDDREQSGGDKRWMLYSGSLDKSVKIWRVSSNMTPMQTPQQQDQPQVIPSVRSFSSHGSKAGHRNK